jgi:hypothetical protein
MLMSRCTYSCKLHKDAHRYWTSSIRLTAPPYMVSSLSNIVVAKLFGGRKRERLVGLALACSFVTLVSGTSVCISLSISEDESATEAEDESATEELSVSPLSPTIAIVPTDRQTCNVDSPLSVFLALDVEFSGTFCITWLCLTCLRLPSEIMVGPNCMGSPASISFLAFKTGIQQT